MAAKVGAPNPLLQYALTSVSANLINRQTIYSTFKLPLLSKSRVLELLLASLKEQMQAVFKDVKYVIINKKSNVVHK
jgi:hypothetical protein